MTLNEKNNLTGFSYRDGKHRLKSIRWMLFYVVVVQTILTLVANIVMGFIAFDALVYLQMLFIELLAYMLPISLYAKENRLLTARDARERFGLKGCKKSLIPWVILAGCGCQFVMILINLPVNLFIDPGVEYIPAARWELLAAIVVVAIIPAFFEELLLRGIVYGVMAEFNTKAAMVFSAVMFALLHGNVAGFAGYLFLGILLVFVLRRTGSLYACMILHLSNNIIAVLMSYFSGVMLELPQETIALFALGVVLTGISILAIAGFTKPAQKINRIKSTELLGQSFVNPPIIFCIIIIALLIYIEMF